MVVHSVSINLAIAQNDQLHSFIHLLIYSLYYDIRQNAYEITVYSEYKV